MAQASLRAQASPGAGAEAVLYTTPSGALVGTIVTTIIVCNASGALSTLRIRVALLGAASAAGQSIIDTTIAAGQTLTLTTPIPLAATDVIRVFAGNAGVSFHAYGQEVT